MPTIPANQKKTPGAKGLKAVDLNEDAVWFQMPKAVRRFALYDSPTKVAFTEKLIGMSDEEAIKAIEAHKEKQARHTTQLYGPNHPQSWENNYSPAIKMLREMGIK